MGCSCSNTKPSTVLKSRHLQSNNAVDSPDKIAIRKGTFIFHKTWNVTKDYQFGPILGQGAFSYVHTAVHRLTGQERAIKTIKKDKITKDMKSNSKSIQEIDILRKIDHPNILRLFEFYEDTKDYHLVTEILKGGELFEFIIASGVLSETIAMHFMRQILCAVNYCHKHGIVHRDLKPENLLLEKRSPTSTLKVIDFGSSTLYNGDCMMSSKFGTSFYVAPEVLKGSYNEKCDIWSCGVILYILLSGKPPFAGRAEKDIIKKVRKGVYSMESSEWDMVTEGGKELVKKMLNYNPALRYSAEDALNDPWFSELPEPHYRGITSIISNMRNFHASEKLQHAVLTFITSQLLSKEETKNLADIFKSIDKNGDGKLSREELLAEFKKTMTEIEAQEEVERILSCVDSDLNGYIDYSEFLMATMRKETLISKKNLETAFKMFDTDENGAISASELKSILGNNVNSADDVWQQIINKVDQDGDGQIDLKEFKDMMMKIFE